MRMIREAKNLLLFLMAALVGGLVVFWAGGAFAADTVIVADMSGDTKPVSLSFEWQPYLDQCPDCTDFTIEFFVDKSPAVASIQITESEHTVDYIDDGKAHNYWIRAKNTAGEESINSTVVKVPPWYPPVVDPDPAETPPGPPAAPKTVTISITFDADQLTIEQ